MYNLLNKLLAPPQNVVKVYVERTQRKSQLEHLSQTSMILFLRLRMSWKGSFIEFTIPVIFLSIIRWR